MELSLLKADTINSQNPVVHINQQGERSDDEGTELETQTSHGSDSVMEDLSFMMFGEMQEPSTPDGMEIATVHWTKSMCALPRIEGYKTLTW